MILEVKIIDHISPFESVNLVSEIVSKSLKQLINLKRYMYDTYLITMQIYKCFQLSSAEKCFLSMP